MLFLFLAAIAACAPTSTQTPACTDSGGRYQQVGMFGTWSCVTDYVDGGKQCTKQSQCAGGCFHLLDSGPTPREGDSIAGTCRKDSAPLGCVTEINDGRAGQSFCED
jgi:hypothetical protein